MAIDSFPRLSRKHGVKVGAGSLCSVEEAALTEIVGQSSIKSAAQRSKAVVLFLETGITVNGLFEPMLPLTQPATKITPSNDNFIYLFNYC